MWARIEGDRVAEVTDIDPEGRFHPSLVWVECQQGVKPGWTFDGENFEPPTQDQSDDFVPNQVTRAQGKAALIMAGLWDDVVAYVDAINDPQEKALALVGLNDTTHWNRTSPLLAAIAAAIGLTEKRLDDLFIEAAKINL